MNIDIEVCCLSISPSLPLYSFTLPENVQLQFKPHCFIQAVCLNSFFIFIFPSRGRWGEAIVPQLLPILRWLTLKYKENSAKHRICKGGEGSQTKPWELELVWNKSPIICCGLRLCSVSGTADLRCWDTEGEISAGAEESSEDATAKEREAPSSFPSPLHLELFPPCYSIALRQQSSAVLY